MGRRESSDRERTYTMKRRVRCSRARRFAYRALLACAVIVGPAFAVDRVAYAEQKPIRDRQVVVDFFTPPESLSEMLREVDAVVVVRYTGRAHVIEQSSPGVPFTNHVFVVNEIIKPDPLLPSVRDELTVRMFSGDMEFASHIERSRIAYTDQLRQGGKYVLFLRRHPSKSTLELAWGPHGVYDISGPTVRTLQRELRRYDGGPSDAFIEALRTAGQ
jgi:hypothetical protein